MSKIKYLALLLFSPLVALAQHPMEGNPENWCRNGFFANEGPQFMTGTAKAKTYFHNDEREDCPQSGNCKGKAYIVANDQVLVSRIYQGYACAYYPSKKGGGTAGWIPQKDLKLLQPNPNPMRSAWFGTWRNGRNWVKISADGTHLTVEGEAYLVVRPDNVRTGNLNGSAIPQGNLLTIEDGGYGCTATLSLIGNVLMINDNGECGGAYVTFDGAYKKSGK